MEKDKYEKVLLPLLSMFAMCDDVFTEDDALIDPNKAKMGFGRIYEEWKRCRSAMDPGYVHRPDERPRKWLPAAAKQGKPERSTRRAST